MLGLTFQSRKVDHAWDPDPEVRARNRRFEAALDTLLGDTYGEPPRRDQGGLDMQGIVSALLKFGLIPGLLFWLIWLGVTEYRVVGNRSLAIIEHHAKETSERMDRLDRTQDRIVNLLRAQCVNAAKNTNERNDCLRAGQ